jgi:hypothetical protein
VAHLFVETYSVFVVSAATQRHLPIVWRDWIGRGSKAGWFATEVKNTEDMPIAKIFEATTYLTSNGG